MFRVSLPRSYRPVLSIAHRAGGGIFRRGVVDAVRAQTLRLLANYLQHPLLTPDPSPSLLYPPCRMQARGCRCPCTALARATGRI